MHFYPYAIIHLFIMHVKCVHHYDEQYNYNDWDIQKYVWVNINYMLKCYECYDQ
jgi:hypothetical protein